MIQFIEFELVINRKAAGALGLQLNNGLVISLLARIYRHQNNWAEDAQGIYIIVAFGEFAVAYLNCFRPAADVASSNRRHSHFRDLRKGISLLLPVPVGSHAAEGLE